MIKSKLNKKSIIEIASIAGIMAAFFTFDRSFGILDWVVNEVVVAFPGFKQYAVNFAGVSFIGLVTYCIMQRIRGHKESLARATMEKFLQQKDFTDANTGLSNRLGFKLMLGELRGSQVLTHKSIVAFEIRNLDSIASVHGEATAGKIENLYSNKLKELCRENDFASRADKGRFYLLINSVDTDESSLQIDNVFDAINGLAEQGMVIDDLTMSIHLNIGLLNLTSSIKNSANWSEDDIIQRLDYLLYLSKSKPHDVIEVYNDKIEDSLIQRAMVEGELLDALKSGEIMPYFQPFIDMKTNKVVGLEILARWEHPTKGFISPDIFVHAADEIGAMRDLTLIMLERACKAASKWPENITLAFNISPNELRNETTMDSFFEILKTTDIDSERVELEITENAFIEEVGEITEAVSRLKKRGVQISIDDFGTGFSNLSHLKILPFDKIKIDQSFIRDMASNSESEAIVKNIIALGKSLGLPTVAEGIEIDANHDALQELGCSVGQGYLYAKALKAEEVMPFINNFKAEIVYLAKVA